jgi:very-short-patch-repair endonuclease
VCREEARPGFGLILMVMGDREPVKRRADRTAGVARDKAPRGAGKRRLPRSANEPTGIRPPEKGGRRLPSQSELATQAEARLGSSFHGAVTREQLLSEGISRHVIDRQAKTGALHRRYHGVYIVGHLALAPLAQEAAALLACGEDAVISHRSAAYLWGLIDEPPEEVEVTVIGRSRRRQAGLKVRQVAHLSASDIRERKGIRLTSPARTIVDSATESTDIQLEALIAEARAKRRLRSGELEAALARAGKRKGVGRLRAILSSQAGQAMTRSETERRCRRLLDAAGLPQPRTNQRVAGCEVDFLWPQHRVVLEVDTITFHGHARAFEWDRRKTLLLEAAGYHVIRVTRRQLEEDTFWVVAQIARALQLYAPAA